MSNGIFKQFLGKMLLGYIRKCCWVLMDCHFVQSISSFALRNILNCGAISRNYFSHKISSQVFIRDVAKSFCFTPYSDPAQLLRKQPFGGILYGSSILLDGSTANFVGLYCFWDEPQQMTSLLQSSETVWLGLLNTVNDEEWVVLK